MQTTGEETMTLYVRPNQELSGRLSLLELKVDERIDALNRRNAELEDRIEKLEWTVVRMEEDVAESYRNQEYFE
jgi:hypothetical protein